MQFEGAQVDAQDASLSLSEPAGRLIPSKKSANPVSQISVLFHSLKVILLRQSATAMLPLTAMMMIFVGQRDPRCLRTFPHAPVMDSMAQVHQD